MLQLYISQIAFSPRENEKVQTEKYFYEEYFYLLNFQFVIWQKKCIYKGNTVHLKMSNSYTLYLQRKSVEIILFQVGGWVGGGVAGSPGNKAQLQLELNRSWAELGKCCTI